MSEPRPHLPVLLVVAAFSRYETVLAWSRERLEHHYGPIGPASRLFPFNQTTYYEKTMGAGLRKQFLVFEPLIFPEWLPDIKRHTNDLEQEQAALGAYPECRPLNLDPGFLTLGKFLLATTKDQAHRIYLRDGIFAEVTLRYQQGAWQPWPWTYADYREDGIRDFLQEARDYYRRLLGAKGPACDD